MGQKSVAIVQSNYIPWKGYFDLIARVDEFVLYDDVQYTRRDWRNRNRVKTPHGVQWLTLPVDVKGRYHQLIRETIASDRSWASDHWRTLRHCYARAPHLADYLQHFEELYGQAGALTHLSDINRLFLEAIRGMLGIRTTITSSTDYPVDVDDRTERLVEICRLAGATEYVSGPAARAYVDEARFERAGIALCYMSYDGYPEYPQLFPPFEHAVSVVDLLFNCGARAPEYMKHVAP